ncbi:hypothetical protein ATN88_19985 [Enterovibrio coralii]|uniref:Response regulatory domain-containing protein n=2 Tax=Enterovibrio coralii TaxID=294935 RepID=A0A135I9G7_9GAMM|nr:hypothetical protein ATN88_19985 [Enterovibrio coralii]
MEAPCGWVKQAFAAKGCKVTRVLHVNQALLAMRQTQFDLLVLAYEDTQACLSDVDRVKSLSVLPLMVLLPDIANKEETSVVGTCVDCLVSDAIPREMLWVEAQTALASKMASY